MVLAEQGIPLQGSGKFSREAYYIVGPKKNILKSKTVWFHEADWHKIQTKYRGVSQPNIATISLILSA